jgi:hypothetical protein
MKLDTASRFRLGTGLTNVLLTAYCLLILQFIEINNAVIRITQNSQLSAARIPAIAITTPSVRKSIISLV